jgi:hypothetical protein
MDVPDRHSGQKISGVVKRLAGICHYSDVTSSSVAKQPIFMGFSGAGFW